MSCRSILIFTHTAMWRRETPDAQPAEHLCYSRASPGLVTLRPCDSNEVLRPIVLCIAPPAPRCWPVTATVADWIEINMHRERRSHRAPYVLSRTHGVGIPN